MLKLLRNELIKVFSTKKMYVFGIIITLVTLLVCITSHVQPNEVIVKPTGQFLPFLSLRILSGQIIPIFIIILTIDMITKEIRDGTFKLPLLHTVSRTKYLTAKIITLIILIVILLFYTMTISYGIGTLFYGWGDTLSVNGATFTSVEGFIRALGSYMINILPLASFSIIMVAISLLFNNTGIAVGVSIGMLFVLDIARQIIPKIAPYIITNSFMLFESITKGITFDNFIIPLVVIIIYSFISLIISLKIINDKDIIY